MGFVLGLFVGFIIGVVLSCVLLAQKNLEKYQNMSDTVSSNIEAGKNFYRSQAEQIDRDFEDSQSDEDVPTAT